MIWLLLSLTGCLERVTGEVVPLDPRFYEAVEASQGEPGVGGGSSVPFSEHEGPTVTVQGLIVSPLDLPVDLDVRVPDSSHPGGVRPVGKVLLQAPGDFELQVPKDLGSLELQAFQDELGDGPTGDDHFGQLVVDVGSGDETGLEIALTQGARQGGPTHTEAPPGAPGGAPGAPGGGGEGGQPGGPGEPGDPAGPGAPGGPGGQGEGTPEQPKPGLAVGPDPFQGMAGDRVEISGIIGYKGDELVDLDLFQPDSKAPGGRRFVGKLKKPGGPFSFEAPAGFGPVILEAFVDIGGDGPGMGDPMGTYPDNPLNIGGSDIQGVAIPMAVPEDGKMPMGPTEGAPGGGL